MNGKCETVKDHSWSSISFSSDFSPKCLSLTQTIPEEDDRFLQ